MDLESTTITQPQLKELVDAAWAVRNNAFVFGPTKVGAAVLTIDGDVFAGCNIEQRFRSHDVHAEVNAITSMVASGYVELVAIVIAAERERFTPCGSCMDWIFQFGGSSCIVGYQSAAGGKLNLFKAHDLMPYYPI